MKYLLYPALLDEFIERHHMLNRQSAPEFLIEWIVVLQVIVGLRHFQQTLSADEVFSFNKGIQAPPAIAGIKKGNEILDDIVGNRITQMNIYLPKTKSNLIRLSHKIPWV